MKKKQAGNMRCAGISTLRPQHSYQRQERDASSNRCVWRRGYPVSRPRGRALWLERFACCLHRRAFVDAMRGQRLGMASL